MQRSSAHHSDEEMTAADEERYLREILRAADGNKAQAARRMNLPRSTFYSKCKKYGIL
jgi:transcriptional regulator with PAS, ATPase and Fis domain